jgi:Flp pilus assembly CpaE family ATPase
MTPRRPKTQAEVNRKKNRFIVAAKLSADLHTQLRAYCTTTGQNINQALRHIITTFLSTHG